MTTVGPHRDELELRINGLPARTHASQGEQRTLALALRLGGHRLVAERTGSAPVLVLDDVLSELDAHRATALLGRCPPARSSSPPPARSPPPPTPTASSASPPARSSATSMIDLVRAVRDASDRAQRAERPDTAAWRGDGMSDPVPMERRWSTVADSIRALAARSRRGVGGDRRRVRSMGRHRRRDVAPMCSPVRLDQGVLTVEVDEPAWATQVRCS